MYTNTSQEEYECLKKMKLNCHVEMSARAFCALPFLLSANRRSKGQIEGASIANSVIFIWISEEVIRRSCGESGKLPFAEQL
jgi:hypothetical protein